MTLNIIISLLFLALSLIPLKLGFEKKGFVKNSKFTLSLILTFSTAFLLRLWLAFNTEGFVTDLNTFKAWGSDMTELGALNVYNRGSFVDYPPGYLYILGFLDRIRRFFEIELYSIEYTFMIKLPSILSDMVCSFIIYFIGKKKVGEINSLIAAALYLFCPAVLINSAVWGQADSFTALLLLISVIFLYNEKIFFAALFYGLGVISKPQMLIFAPLFLLPLIYRKKFKKLIMGILTSLAVILLLALPFTRNFDFTWLIEKYISTIDYYAYYTINAYNFWGLIGFNWKNLPYDKLSSFLLNALGPVIAVVLSAILLYKKKLQKEFAVNDKYRAVYFACPALLMFTVYIFATKMHERYLFPALLFILLSYIFTSDKRFLLVFSASSFLHFLNVSYVLYLNNEYVAPDAFEIILLSLLHLVVYFYFLYVLWSVFKKGKIVKKINLKIGKGTGKWVLFPEKSKKFDSHDVIIAIILTVFYSIFALNNVGSTKVVDKNWTPESGESVILKCDSPVDKLLYLPGIGVNELNNNGDIYRASRVGANILIEYSLDGEIFMELTREESPYVYQWQELKIGDGFKYLRITSIGFNTTIGEIGAFYKGQQAELTLLKGKGEALLDEQEMVPAESTWENSTYFDEIYHARTAYEYLIGAEPYENTHPTLGKLLISVGIIIFGMCPFGWRIVGVVFGILMLPVLYRLIRRLFESKIISASCTLIFAFDFMHFTQTRIATIDTYAVFFILLMFNFIISFVSKDIYKEKLSKLLVPLFLSGLFMGFGIAAKWNVAYAALGLALIYFAKIFISIKENYSEGNMKEIIKRPLKLSLFCVLFFIVIPFGIYFTSFLVCTLLPQNTYDIFGRFIAYQTHMFDYHANLEATHYFASPWYEWPLDLRNIWYYGESNLSVNSEASTIVCLGNPITWWVGLLSLLLLAFDFVRNKTKGMAVILIGFLSAYLPWVLISRLTFVYHYFTAVPFIIMAMAYFFNKLQYCKNLSVAITNKGIFSKVKIYELSAVMFLIVALIMFIAFYPAISGAKSDYYYLKGLEWLENWYFI